MTDSERIQALARLALWGLLEWFRSQLRYIRERNGDWSAAEMSLRKEALDQAQNLIAIVDEVPNNLHDFILDQRIALED